MNTARNSSALMRIETQAKFTQHSIDGMCVIMLGSVCLI